MSICRPADLPTIQNIHTWLILYYILRGVSIFSSWSVYVPTCRPADQPLIVHIHTLAYHILNHIPLYLPTCRATSYSMFYIYLYLTLYLSICRPADPPLMLNIIYMHKGYSIFSLFIYLTAELSICRRVLHIFILRG